MEVVREVRVISSPGCQVDKEGKKKSLLNSGEAERTLERFAWFRNGHRSCGWHYHETQASGILPKVLRQ